MPSQGNLTTAATSSAPHTTQHRVKMESFWLNVYLARVLLLGCVCVVALGSQTPGQVDPLELRRVDSKCWESSSALLLELQSPRIADNVPAFWDLMIFLKSSDKLKHSALFWDLAQLFWDIYVDCVLSRTHGLGRRQLTRPQQSVLTRPMSEVHRANGAKQKEFIQDWFRVQGQRVNPDLLGPIPQALGIKTSSSK